MLHLLDTKGKTLYQRKIIPKKTTTAIVLSADEHGGILLHV